MSTALDKLNLRPGEKRLVVAVAVVVFIVLNYIFVWPHFGEVGRTAAQLERDHATIEKYRREIARESQIKRQLADLETQGSAVATAEQALQLQVTVQRQASSSGVAILSSSASAAGTGKLSDFFEEQILRVTANSGDKELVDFLFKIGSGDSLIRVRDLSLGPDATGSKLNSTITFVASYQRATPATPAAAKKAVTTAKTP